LIQVGVTLDILHPVCSDFEQFFLSVCAQAANLQMTRPEIKNKIKIFENKFYRFIC